VIRRGRQAFRQGLADLAWVEGRNLYLDVRWAGPNAEPQRSHARELVGVPPEALLSPNTTTTTTQALRTATTTMPIVFL
jgi:putative ABC transport system substrate-binding protein